MNIVIANGPGRLDNGADVILFPSRWDSAVQAAPFRFYPYELALLCTLLKRELPGANVTMLDGNLHQWDGDQYIQEISTLQPDVLICECSALTYGTMARVMQGVGARRAILCGPMATYAGALIDGWTDCVMGEYEAKVLKEEAAKRNITVVEQAVANSGEVLQAAQVLADKKVEAFVKIGDYATIQGFGSIAKVGLEKKIPVYSVDADDIKLPGCLATIGWAYFDDGYAAGKLAVRVLKGESPATMAFEPLTKTELLVSKATAQAIGVTLPEALLEEAKEVVG